uniref:Uncharacterized protein n=1 Tax=Nicotiana tabacum TaxID=4097 RepID=A0A1S4CXD5_TOBAC|nr:PREDICTED: uncharacterized protein LOC107823621 [Nicotiana tabacum]
MGRKVWQNRKKRDEGSMMTSGSREVQRGASHPYMQVQQGQSSYPQHYYPPPIPEYSMGPPQYTMFNARAYGRPPNQLLPLKHMGMIGPIAPHHIHPDTHGFQSNARCEYHSGAPGHSTDDYWTLNKAIERLIAEKLIVVTNDENPPNVTNNPLPAHNDVHFEGIIGRDHEYKQVGSPLQCSKPKVVVLGGHPIMQNQGGTKGITEPILIKLAMQPRLKSTKTIPSNYNKIVVTYKGKEIIEEVGEVGDLTRSGRCYSPEDLRKAKQIREGQMPIKKLVIEEEAEKFLKKTKVQDYSIVDQLRKTPAQISLLSLLIHSKEHARVVIKILNEVHVLEKTTVNQFTEVNKITFTDDELPEEGAGHNMALHLTVKYGGHYVKRVMVDGGSSVDVFPLSTL